MLRLFRKKSAIAIDKTLPLRSASFVVVDTELTGLDEKKDSIVSIGAVRMTGGRIDLGDTFYRLVSPATELTAASVVVHQIMPSEVAEKPGIETVLDEFADFCGDALLAGHFIAIDLAFLNREMKRLRNRTMEHPAIDTFSIYTWLRKRGAVRECGGRQLEKYRLYEIGKCFDIPSNGGHNAIMDAFITAQLLQRLLPLLEEAGIEDLDDLLRIGEPFKGGDDFGLTGEFGNF